MMIPSPSLICPTLYIAVPLQISSVHTPEYWVYICIGCTENPIQWKGQYVSVTSPLMIFFKSGMQLCNVPRIPDYTCSTEICMTIAYHVHEY